MSLNLVDVNGNPFLTDIVQQAQTLSSLNAANNMTVRGQATAVIKITGSTATNTIVFQGSVDGTNYDTVQVYPVAGGPSITSVAGGTNGAWWVPIAGFNKFQALMSAFTSGSAVVSIVCSQGTMPPPASAAGNVRDDLVAWAGTALGTPTNFGTTPGAVIAGSTNASLFLGTTAARSNQTTTAAGVVDVNLAGLLGTTLVQAAAGIIKLGLSGATGVTLDAASNAAVPTNGLYVLGRGASANPTAVTTGNTVAPFFDLLGKVVTTPVAPRLLVKHQATAVAVTTETTIITAGGAGVFNDLVTLIVTTAVATAGTLTIRDVTAAGTPWIINYPNAALAPGTPLIISFGAVPLQQGTANSAWTITNSQAVAINVTAQYAQRTA